MIGTTLLAIAATVSIIGVLKDNKPKDGEKAILGLNRVGFTLLLLAVLAFGLGFAKDAIDASESADAKTALLANLDQAEKDRDLAAEKLDDLQQNLADAETERESLQADLQESRDELQRVKGDLTKAITMATEGVRKEIDHPVVTDLLQQPRPVVSQVTRRPLVLKAGDEVQYFFYGAQSKGTPAILTVGKQSYKMVTNDQGRGAIRVVGTEGAQLPVEIRAISPLPFGGVKMTIVSSYTPDVLPLLRETLDGREPKPDRQEAKPMLKK